MSLIDHLWQKYTLIIAKYTKSTGNLWDESKDFFNEFFFILWILSDAFELDDNIVNFVYYGKPRFEFFLNDFPWIHWIQWILTKFKIVMVTKKTPHLLIVMFSDEVVKWYFYYYVLIGIYSV